MNTHNFLARIRRVAVSLTGLTLVASAGLAMTAAPSQAADGDFKFTVVAKDLAVGQADFSIDKSTRLLVNGATQVSWENPNHNLKVTKKQLRKAPRIKVRATGANSSAVIFKKARKAKIVVLKKGSCVRNTGRENHLRVGFVWCLKADAVLVLDKKSRQYRHAYNIIGGKLVKTCLNYIGGNVPMRNKVVQVRYEQDVKKSGEAVAKAVVGGPVTFSVTCPNGANFNTTVTTSAYGYGRSAINYTERTRVSALNAKKFELINKANVDGSANALAAAETNIEVSGNCGSQEPEEPETPEPTLDDITLVNFVKTGDKITLTVNGTVANGHTGELFCKALNGGTITSATKLQSVSGRFTAKVDYVAPGEIPGELKDAGGNVIVPAAHDMVECKLTQNDNQSKTIRTAVGPGKFEIRGVPSESE